MKNIFKLILIVAGILSFSVPSFAQEISRQNAVSIQCGSQLESEFSLNYEEHTYAINLDAGTTITASIVPLGAGLQTTVVFYGPTNLPLVMNDGDVDNFGRVASVDEQTEPTVTVGPLGTRGNHLIRITNFKIGWYYPEDNSYSTIGESAGVGFYTISIGCILRDGTVIEPGDILDDEPVVEANPVGSPFSGFGFPGLNPVDFSVGVSLPLTADIANPGSITPGFAGIFGYTFEADANEAFNLQFNRASGNLNLNLVVLSANNEVVFQSSLISTNQLNADFSTLSAGQYTIGVSLMNLSPPANPEVTQFQIMLTR